MAAVAHSLHDSRGQIPWLWEFLKHELAPYRGRAALAARMVLASTLVMILCMTFRIPNGAFAAFYALVISRQSGNWTARSAATFLGMSTLALAYALLGAVLVSGSPMLRFLWVMGTFFLSFYGLSAIKNYGAALIFGFITIIIVPLFDSPVSGEVKISGALWTVGGVALGAVTAVALEKAVSTFAGSDGLAEAIDERLARVEELLTGYAGGHASPEITRSELVRLAMVGTSRLRQNSQRSHDPPQHQQQMGALIALAGRLVDLGANLVRFSGRLGDGGRERSGEAARSIAEIRSALMHRTRLDPTPPLPGSELSNRQVPAEIPLSGIEKTVALMREVLAGDRFPPVNAPASLAGPAHFLSPDAFSNPAHLRFALRGCLAAGLCYVIYSALFWPGLATSTYTCVLTALTTIGASHQKQFFRFAGAIIGGLLIGVGSQVFILPYIDSIAGFTVLFAAVAGLSAWIATSSSRLNYLGLQIAVYFYLINLQVFGFQTSLVVARDRSLSVVLGLAMMWLAYDRLWVSPAGVEMKKAFVSVIRMLAQFAREPVSEDCQVALDRGYALRETINAQFDKVRSLADGVLFEFGPARQRDLALRERIREWQPQLRTLFLMRIASLNYRLQLPGFELPQAALLSLRAFDDRSAALLEDVAGWIEGTARPGLIGRDAREGQAPSNLPSFAALVRGIDNLTNSIAEEIARTAPPILF